MNPAKLLTALFLSACALPASAGTAELNRNRGLWDFDGDLNSRFSCFGPAVTSSNLSIGTALPGPFWGSSTVITPQVQVTEWLDLSSETSSGAGLQTGEWLAIPNLGGPNGFTGASYTNNWTIVLNVRWPAISGWASLVNDTSGSEGEIFRNPSGGLVFWGATTTGNVANPVVSDNLAANTWYQLAFTAEYNAAAGKQILRCYVNGTPTTQTSGGNVQVTADGVYGLTSRAYLSADDNNETNRIQINSAAMWAEALSAADIAALGGHRYDGITWPGLDAAAVCPMNGNLYFGSFLTTFNPATAGNIGATATAPTVSGAIADITLNIPANTGTIPGKPQHKFGGAIRGHLMQNGNVLSTEDIVNVNYTGSGPDMETTANVTYRRVDITLRPTGCLARSLNIYLPAGFGVADTESNRLLQTSIQNFVNNAAGIPLAAGLVPQGSYTFGRGDFGMGVGGGYPTNLWAVLDRMPVRWPATGITWNAAEGTFSHATTGNLIYHQELEINVMAGEIAQNYAEASLRPSNDQFYYFARNAVGNNVVSARTDGTASVTNAVATLDLAKYPGFPNAIIATHFPYQQLQISTGTAGRIAWVNDQIDQTQSRLRNVTSNASLYHRSRPSAGCDGELAATNVNSEALFFTTPSNEWFFTPDGGLRADFTFTAPVTVEWGGWNDGGLLFAHSITTAFPGGRALIGGHIMRGPDAAAFADFQRPAAMLFSGHSSPASSTVIERPNTSGYSAGTADYPGYNLRTDGSYNAISRLAGSPTSSYPLRNTSKYYLRPGGVNGRHDSSGAGTSFTAYGTTFNVSALRLSFLDGLNLASGVNGNLSIPAPASFGLSFRELLFGARGQLLAATVSPAQGDITLGPFWNFRFTPLALEFPQPKVCPDPAPSTGFVKIGARATMAGMVRDIPLTGNLGFASGNIVVESDPVATGLGAISRFEPGGQLSVPGPGTSNWSVNPVSGIYLNKANVDGNTSGTLSAAGRMNLPFFEDMPVHLVMSSNNVSSGTPAIQVRKPWENFTAASYDAGHLGHPPGVPPSTYASTPAWNPVCQRDWQDLISFNFPVSLGGSTRWFESVDYTDDDVFIFHLRQGIQKMTPENAELQFDGEANVGLNTLLDQVNISSLVGNPNLLSLPAGAVKDGINAAIASVTNLDGLLADNLAALLQPGLQEVASSVITTTYYTQLATAPDKSARLNDLAPDLASYTGVLLGGNSSGMNGQWRRDLLAKVTAARAGMQSAKAIVQTAANLQQLAAAMQAHISGSGSPVAPDNERLAAIQQFFDQVIARLTQLENALSPTGELTIAMNTALSSAGGPALWVQQALNDVKLKWAPANSDAALAFFSANPPSTLAANLASALADRAVGSVFSGTAMQLLRQHVGDTQTMARQAVDDALRFAENLISQTLDSSGTVTSALGNLSNYTAAARLKGYARINGDSLAELRLDGQVRLKVPDDMKFDGWFLLRSLDSTTPNAACLAAGGAKAEVAAGATADFMWGTKPNVITLGGKVALDGSGSPVGLCGDFGLSREIDFQAVKLQNIKFGFGFGANNGYLYARGAGKMQTMDVAAGVFIGQTCDLGVIANADPDIGGLLPQILPGYSLPVKGAMLYAEGGMSLMPLIGIPPSCVLDLRVSGGQGFFGFAGSSTVNGDGSIPVVAGIKQKLGVSGELLCLVDVSGSLAAVLAAQGTIKDGGLHFQGLSGTARATVRGEVGVSPFSWDFEKSIGLKLFANPSVTYSIDF